MRVGRFNQPRLCGPKVSYVGSSIKVSGDVMQPEVTLRALLPEGVANGRALPGSLADSVWRESIKPKTLQSDAFHIIWGLRPNVCVVLQVGTQGDTDRPHIGGTDNLLG